MRARLEQAGDSGNERQIKMRRFTGNYAPDGKSRRMAVCESVGNRCIRCGHPYEKRKHGRGQWTPCDSHCSHDGPVKTMDGKTFAEWRILTVHHLDGDKSNDSWWNTLPLCQRCHLQVQGKVDPEIPYFLEHSEWIKPYIAGLYAKKYEGREITRKEAESSLQKLLGYETKTTERT